MVSAISIDYPLKEYYAFDKVIWVKVSYCGNFPVYKDSVHPQMCNGERGLRKEGKLKKPLGD